MDRWVEHRIMRISEFFKELTVLQHDQWTVLPKFVKIGSLAIGLPAWVILAVSVVSGKEFGAMQTTAFGVFVAAALVQIFFLVRAYWRKDIY